jgi:hypothetical protein
MKLKAIYCTTVDGFGEDVSKEFNIEELQYYSNLSSKRVILFHVIDENENLIQCVLDYLNIEIIQLITLELI